MATKAAGAGQANGVAKRSAIQQAAAKKPATKAPSKKATPVTAKAASVAGGETVAPGVGSAYWHRIANRVAEMAENMTLVERARPTAAAVEPAEDKRRPRKLEMRLEGGGQDSVAFSAPFLDNTLQKMLSLQNRMLRSTAELSKSEKVDGVLVKEHAAQSAELCRIIALICAEKARQGT